MRYRDLKAGTGDLESFGAKESHYPQGPRSSLEETDI